MADLSGIDLDSIPSDPKKALSSAGKGMSEEMRRAKDNSDREKASTDKYSSDVAEISKKEGDLSTEAKQPGGALTPPQLTDYKAPPPKDPWQQWGSPAMWLAGLSTFMGRRSLTRSLTTAGSYLNAVKENDDARAKQAFDAWKQDNENAIKMHDWQVDAYKEAMKNLREDKSGAREEVQTLAYSLAHDPMLQALDKGREQALSLYDTMIRHGDELRRTQPEIEDHQFRMGMQKQVAAIQQKRNQDLAQPGADPKHINDVSTAAINDLTQQADMYFGRASKGTAKSALELTPDQIEALYTGKTKMSDYGIRGADRAAAMSQVTNAHPDFSSRLYDIRKGIDTQYRNPNGVANKNIVASNTALGHIDQLRELAKGMQNGDNQIVNHYVNMVRTIQGHSDVTTPQMAVTAIGEEMMKAFRQVGASEKEAEEWKGNLNVKDFSPEQIDKSSREAIKLLMPRLDTLNENWKTDMGTDENFDGLLTPNSRKVLENLDINYPGRSAVGKGAPKPGEAKPESDDFVKGKVYKDKHGGTAKYLGDGKWEEQ